MKDKKFFKSYNVLYLIVGILSILLFIGIYGVRILNPLYTDWLTTPSSNSDITQHYLGWLAYRSSPWTFPFGLFDKLSYPNSTSIVFSDSIPLFAIFFKIISPILPKSFQYFGLWGLFCFILQGELTVFFVKKYTRNKIAVILFSLLVILSPVFITRMFGHTALAGHWLLLLSIGALLNLEKFDKKVKLILFALALALLSSSVHVYLLLMNGIILTGISLLMILKKKNIIPAILMPFEYIAAAAVNIFLLGGFSSGMNMQTDAITGFYSFNLNGFINSQGTADIFKDLILATAGQYEGYAYLGAGIIVFLPLSVILFLVSGDTKDIFKKHYRLMIAVTYVFCMALLIAISPTVTFGSKTLLSLPVPSLLKSFYSVFRACGRLAWVCIYLIEFCSFIMLCKAVKKKKIFVLALLFALCLQIFDLHSLLFRIHNKFTYSVEYTSNLEKSELWSTIASDKSLKHIYLYSTIDRNELYDIAEWAVLNDKTLNEFHFARESGDEVYEIKETVLDELPEDTVYIFSDEDILKCSKYNLYYYRFDDLIIGCTYRIEGFVPMNPSDFVRDWYYGNNMYIFEESGCDTDNGRIIYPDGFTFGPYFDLPKGKYLITVNGNDLPDDPDISITSEKGTITHDKEILDHSSSSITVEINLSEDTKDLELLFVNNSEEDTILSHLTFQYIEP